MQTYLLQVSYTSNTIAALLRNPHDRSGHIRASAEQLGGKMDGMWAATGDYDVVALFQFPDHIIAGAFRAALAAGGACTRLHMTPLYDISDSVEALKLAATSIYRPATADVPVGASAD